jgi:hypothetical protein
MGLPLTASAWAQVRHDPPARHPSAEGCMQRLHRDQADLPAASRQARDRLIANPARIDLVAVAAVAADERRRAEIELGIFRAAEWLRCLDPSGYQALASYLRLHSGDPVVVDLQKALDATASATAASNPDAAASAAPTSSSGASPGLANGSGFNSSSGGSPSFSVVSNVVSPSH